MPIHTDPDEPNLWRTLQREAVIAAETAAVITLVLLVRRWTAALLGEGLLDEEVLRETTVVTDLMQQLERRARSRKETNAHVGSTKRQARGPRTRPSGQ